MQGPRRFLYLGENSPGLCRGRPGISSGKTSSSLSSEGRPPPMYPPLTLALGNDRLRDCPFGEEVAFLPYCLLPIALFTSSSDPEPEKSVESRALLRPASLFVNPATMDWIPSIGELLDDLSGGRPLRPLDGADLPSIDLERSRRNKPALMTSDLFPSSEEEEGPPFRKAPPAGTPFAFRRVPFFFPILTSTPSSDLKVKFWTITDLGQKLLT